VCGGGNIFGGGGRLGWRPSLTFGGGGLGGGGGDFGIGIDGGFGFGWIIWLFSGGGGGNNERRLRNETVTMQLVCDSIIPWKMMNANK
jgi:hypothetical protein